MELNEKEIHCIARMLQGAIFTQRKDVHGCCVFCKYFPEEPPKNGISCPQYHSVLKKLTKISGVDLSFGVNVSDHLPPFYQPDFWIINGHVTLHPEPYLKFLRNANDSAKKHFEKFLTQPPDESWQRYLKKICALSEKQEEVSANANEI